MTETVASETQRPGRPADGPRAPARGPLGLAGRTARAFVESPLTPLLLMAFFLIGLLGMVITPREEDPQISVPMVDVFVAYPGAAASEVANLISEPLERLMSELPGVKHVYSMSRDGLSMVTVRFEVGEQMEPSLVKLYNKLYSNMDAIPKGVMQPLVKPKSIDDVPVVTVTLSSIEARSGAVAQAGARRAPALQGAARHRPELRRRRQPGAGPHRRRPAAPAVA